MTFVYLAWECPEMEVMLLPHACQMYKIPDRFLLGGAVVAVVAKLAGTPLLESL